MSEKMRQDFEEWAAKQGYKLGRDYRIDRYESDLTRCAWDGWRAATPKAFGDGWIAAMTWGKKDGCDERG